MLNRLPYEHLFVFSLLTTTLIEFLCLYSLIRYYFKIKANEIPNNLLVFSSFVSFGTLPYVWFILPAVMTNYLAYIFASEVLVILTEAIFYYFVLKLSFKKSLFISFICNLAAFSSGLLIERFF